MKNSKSAQTRTKIIQTAKELFRENGYHKTTLGMIADRSGISVSLIKKYFQQKKTLAFTIDRQQAFKIKKYVNEILQDSEFQNDALMEYLLTIQIMFRSLYSDESSRRFHYEIIENIERSNDIYLELQASDYISELYENIVKQFNTGMKPEEFRARKIQIAAAQNAIGKAYIKGDKFCDDLTRLDYSVSAACMLLGVSSFVYASYNEKAANILKNIDADAFKLL